MNLFKVETKQPLLGFLPALTITLLLVDCVIPTNTFADPIVPSEGGAGSVVTTEGDHHTITGGIHSSDGSNLFHEFEQFNVPTNEIADFLATPELSNILTLINGGTVSSIDGLLQVTGGDANLFLINPAGVLIGENAVLNLEGGFTVTTADSIGFGETLLNLFDENNYADLVGHPDAFVFTAEYPGVIVNEGDLTLTAGQPLMLVGGTVINTGSLATENGTVTIAAVPGEQWVRISQEGNLLNLELATTDELSALNSDAVIPFTPLSLPDVLTGGGVDQASNIAVNPDGTVQLTGVDGAITVNPETTLVSGNLTTIDETGGAITVLGEQVGLAGAELDASGTNGGGTIRIGGDYQGQGIIPNATQTFVSADSHITADALSIGDGGQIITWADGDTVFYGSARARGGSTSGNGGFVEISGQENLLFAGTVNLTATNGDLGLLLLDPTNIFISNEASNPPAVDAQLPTIFQTDFENSITVNATTLQNQAADIRLEATNDIEVAAGTNLDFVDGGSITFAADADADDNGIFRLNVGGVINTNGRSLTIIASDVELESGSLIDVASGDVTFQPSTLDKRIAVGLVDNNDFLDQNGDFVDISELFKLSAPEITESLESTGTLTIGNPGFSGTGEVQLRQLSFLGDENYNLTIRGGDIRFRLETEDITSNNNIDTNVSLRAGRTAQFISTGVISEGNARDLLIDGNGSVLFDSATGVVGFLGTDNLDIRVTNIAARNRVSGDIQIVNTRESVITSVGGVNGLSTAGNGSIDIRAGNFNNGAGNLTVDQSIVADGSGSISIQSADGIIVNSSIISETGDITFDTPGGTTQINNSIISTQGSVQTGDITTDGQDLSINSADSIVTGTIVTTGLGSSGDISFVAENNIATGRLESLSTTGNAGDVSLQSNSGNITVESIFSEVVNDTGNAGSVNLSAPTGDINLTGESGIQARAAFDGDAVTPVLLGNAGNIDISAGGNVAIGGEVDARSEATSVGPTSQTGQGGNVTIVADGDLSIEVGIVTRSRISGGGSNSQTGRGGDINLQSGGSLLIDGPLYASSFTPGTTSVNGLGDAGDISLVAEDDITITGRLEALALAGNAGDVSSTGDSGDISLQSNSGNITVESILTFANTGNAGSVTLRAPTGNIATTTDGIRANVAIGNGGSVETDAGGSVSIEGSIDTRARIAGSQSTGRGGDITVRSGEDLVINGQVLSTSIAGNTTGTPVSTDQAGDVNLSSGGNITIEGDPVAIDTRSQTVVFEPTNSQAGPGGDITVTADGNISINGRLISASLASNGATPIPLEGSIVAEAGDITIQSGGDIDLRSGATPATPQSILALSPTRSGTVTIEAEGDFTFVGEDNRPDGRANSILAGEVTFRAGGEIDFNLSLDDAIIATTGQNVTFSANEDIRIRNAEILTGLESPLNTLGTVDNVALLSESGGVFTDNLINTQNTVGNSGSVAIEALTEIQADVIDTSSLTGNAGDVSLDPIGDIEVVSINATAPNGIGGDVEVIAGDSFRVTDSFTDFNGIDASISTAGASGNGSVTIFHGGNGITPFTVGDASTNGTQAAITTGSDTILPTQEFFDPYLQGNIQIITTSPQQPTLETLDTLTSPDIFENEIAVSSESTLEPTVITITYNDPEVIDDVLGGVEASFEQQYEDYYGGPLGPETSQAVPPPEDNPAVPLSDLPTSTPDIDPTAPLPVSSPATPTEEASASAQIAPSDPPSFNDVDTTPGNTDAPDPNSTGTPPSNIETIATDSNTSLDGAGASNPSAQAPVTDPNINIAPGTPGSEDSAIAEPDSPESEPSDSNEEGESTLIKAQNTIRDIQSATGANPAIIYAFFAPSNEFISPQADTADTPDGTTSQSTQPTEVLWAFNSEESLPMLLAQLQSQAGCEGREDDQLFLVLVTGEEEVVSQNIPSATCSEVIETASDFRNAIYERSENYLAPSQQLYAWLINPLIETLEAQDINNLVFIMDQGLRATPLAALHDGEQFLIEQDYSLGLMPSLNLTDTRYQNIQNAGVLPAGVSDFSSQNLDNLPAVPFEIGRVTDNSPRSGDPLLEDEATRNNLRSAINANPYGIVHLATHARFNRGDANQSYIQLWDQKLRLSEVRDMGWEGLELLILSACETASDSYEAELGFAGFASQAGVKSTLASLWNISDIGTAALMIEFYTQLRSVEIPIKAEAIRQTQLAMLNGAAALESDTLISTGGNVLLPESIQTVLQENGTVPDLSHPFYWSGFTLVGSPW